MRSWHFAALSLAALGSVGPLGCVTESDDQLDSIRQALPKKEPMQLDGPETAAASATDTANTTDAGVAPANAPYATFYTFTRNVRDGVNRITAGVLGTVWFIVNVKPTRDEGDQVIWGPYTDALEPATWRFRVTHQGGLEYDYVLEGRPKESRSDQDYRAVLTGVGYAQGDPKHGDGSFSIDLDVARALDPVAHANDSGKVTVVHDLPPTVTTELAPLPRTIEVKLLPSDSAAHLDILSIARVDHTGTIIVDGLADVDESKNTALEDVTVASQWNALGAGRADVTLAGGDVPAALSPVTLVECWDTQFKQSYYKDSAGIAATAGDISACAFSDVASAD
jgi:hypothetical protein